MKEKLEKVHPSPQPERIYGRRWEKWEDRAVEQIRMWQQKGYQWIRVDPDGICHPQKEEPPANAKWVDEVLKDDQNPHDKDFEYPDEYIRIKEGNENAITTVAIWLIGQEAVAQSQSK